MTKGEEATTSDQHDTQQQPPMAAMVAGPNVKKSPSVIETYYEAGEAGSEGKVQFPDGSKYEGGLQNGKMQGEGRLEFADGNVYTGGWEQGQMEGVGKLEYASGDVYEGEFKAGLKHGQGKFVGANGAKYDGQWAVDQIEGKGSILYPDGRTYVGEFKNFDKHGRGKCVYKNGAVYEGHWQRNKRHGRGLLVYPSGAQYDGGWHQGAYQGKGSYVYSCGDLYEGDFVQDHKHGSGKYVWDAHAEVQSLLQAEGGTLQRSGALQSSQGEKHRAVSHRSEQSSTANGTSSASGFDQGSISPPVAKDDEPRPDLDSERYRLYKKAELIRNTRARSLEADASKPGANPNLFHNAAEVVGEATTLQNAAFDDLLVAEHNFVRSNPQKYASTRVTPLLKLVKGKSVQFPSGIIVDTQEGAAAINSLLLALAKRQPCRPLELDYALSRAASEHARDLCDRAVVDHLAFDGATLQDRIKRHGTLLDAAENIATVFATPADIVLALLIDDADPDKKRRAAVLDHKFTAIGCSPCLPHPARRNLTVFNYATGFQKIME